MYMHIHIMWFHINNTWVLFLVYSLQENQLPCMKNLHLARKIHSLQENLTTCKMNCHLTRKPNNLQDELSSCKKT